MLNTLRNHSIRSTRVSAAISALLLAGSGVATAANVTVDLCATAGATTVGSATNSVPANIPVWAYTTGACPAAAAPTAPGGPVINVTVGDVVTVNLSNALAQKTGLFFQGQTMVPDATGAPAFSAGVYGTKSYTFTASSPGTFLYQAALLPNAEHQVAMGLYGALVVKPLPVAPRSEAGNVTSGSADVTDGLIVATDVGSSISGTGIPAGAVITAVTPNVSFTMSTPAIAAGDGTVVITQVSAYGDYTTAYNDEAVLVLSEIDPALNSSAVPAGFDMRKFTPRYFLINGKAYPDTTAITSAAGHKLLLRYVNAGSKHHSMGALGLRQNFIAKDGSVLPTAAVSLTAETLATGQTGDALISVPAVTSASKFAVYDANLKLHNSNTAGMGGMLTFVNASAAGSGPAGPSTSGVQALPNPTNGGVNVALSATVGSASSTVTAVEYFIDAVGANGTGTPMAFDAASSRYNATLLSADVTALPVGPHTIYVHGLDAATNWGAIGSTILNVDKVGPTTSAVIVTPLSINGTATAALSATASDAASGSSNITDAQYTIDNGAPIPLTLGGSPGSVRTLSGTIAAGLAAGPHAIRVQSKDAAGNLGALSAPVTLTVVTAAPVVTSNVIVQKTPNNGTIALSASQPVVRVTATLTTSGTTVAAAEAFIDTVGATGTGIPLVPSDGIWNGATEVAYADIPLTTINSLATGSHTIYVRGKPAVGVWGNTASSTLLIDKTAPTISSASLLPDTVKFGPGSVTLNVAATDTGGAGVAGGQYWIDGSATPPASPTAFTGTSATINTSALAGGTHTVYVRVQDGATNFSAVSSASLTVIRAVNDARSFNANVNATQNNDAGGNSVLSNDLPTGTAGRTAQIVTAPAGTGTATISVTCPGSLGTAATPAVNGNTVCTNGAYRVTLTAPGSATTGTARQASKRGTYLFTYQEILNGVTSNTATVTITVN